VAETITGSDPSPVPVVRRGPLAAAIVLGPLSPVAPPRAGRYAGIVMLLVTSELVPLRLRSLPPKSCP